MVTASERPRRVVLRAARLFDGERFHEAPGAILIMDGPTIVSAGTAPLDDTGIVVDLPGTTIMPGLVDTHVHLAFDASADPVAALAARDREQTVQAMIEAARTALRGGVTTVRDLGDRDYLAVEVRDRTGSAHTLTGLPTILAAGPPLTTPGGHCHYLGGEVADQEQAVRASVREHAERGCDVIKVMASGGQLTPNTRQDQTQFQPSVLAAAADEAHRLGLPINAHAHATAAVAAAIAAGVDGIEHASFWSTGGVDDRPGLRQQIADRGIVVSATVGQVPVPGAVTPPAVLARLPQIIANHRDLVARGATVVAGTDAGIGLIKPHDVLRWAPPFLAELGLSPVQVLQTITSVAGEVIGRGSTKGRLASGFDADVLVVDGDPRTDPEALHRIRAVYHRGVLVPR